MGSQISMLTMFALCVTTRANTLMGQAVECAFQETCGSHDWRRVDGTSGENMALIFAVKNANVGELEELLWSVSDPYSPSRGKYLSGEEVRALTTDKVALETVMGYLSKFDDVIIDPASTESFIRVLASKSSAEEMFSTDFYAFKSDISDAVIYRTPAYYLPEQVANSVDFVSGTVNFMNTISPVLVESFGTEGSSSRLSLNGQVTPEVLKETYNIVDDTCTNPRNSNSFFGSLNQAFAPDDLTQFQALYNLADEQVDTTIGPNDYGHCPTSTVDCGEATLDVQYIKGVARNVTTTFWSVPACETCVNEPFIEWLVAVEAASNPPLVHSISYTDDENTVPTAEMLRFNEEAIKLGVRGLTLVAGSGDDGVGGAAIREREANCGFNPSYPASSPYVVSVGGSQGPESGGGVEVACQSDLGGVITTGGGFSHTFGRPHFQSGAVDGYFNSIESDALPPSEAYNHTGRGYPDVSLLAYNYNTILNGVSSPASGTSASTPVMAAIITLLNDARLNAGLSPLGYVTPTLYALAESHPSIFHDITSGYNNCGAGHDVTKLVCCKYGFEASRGWDPVTGLGSVDVEALKQAVLALP